MTKEDKQERRQARHSLMKAVRSGHFSTEAKLHMTGAQLRSRIREVTDQLIAGKNPGTVEHLN